jgi:N-acetylmuramoyl-L-alanine amidase
MMPREAVFRGGRRVSACLPILCMVLLVWCELVPCAQAGVEVRKIRFWTSPGSTRVVLDLSGPAAYDLRRVSHPERIAINIADATFREDGTIVVGNGAIRRIRRNATAGQAQIVLDLIADLDHRHFFMPADENRPDRIVVDVLRREREPDPATAVAPDPPGTGAVVTVIIDPGHGGMDPGAIRAGVREKDVVLGIAAELARLLNARDGYTAILTREGDYFVSLAERVQFAERSDGDLFLSIHANTSDNTSASGMDAFFLTLDKATDSEAQALADKENAADRMGLSPEQRRDDVLSILMDLRMNRIIDQSGHLAVRLLGATRRDGPVAGRQVRQAGFHVLQTLAMPSVLVEAAYLSNSADRKLLNSRDGQKKLAQVLLQGVLDHLDDVTRIPATEPQSWLTRYRVRNGDTLWSLANRFETSVPEILERNGMTSDRLAVGQTLLLP